MVGVPINAIFDWPMGTSSGHNFFLDADVNACLKKVLNSWGKFLMVRSLTSLCPFAITLPQLLKYPFTEPQISRSSWQPQERLVRSNSYRRYRSRRQRPSRNNPQIPRLLQMRPLRQTPRLQILGWFVPPPTLHPNTKPTNPIYQISSPESSKTDIAPPPPPTTTAS
jgi:hypothetical protein